MRLAQAFRAMLATVLVASSFLVGFLPSATAQTLVPVPALTAHVIDQTATLSAAETAALEAKLSAFEQQRGAQVVMLLVPTTGIEDLTDFAQRVGDSWKIGRRDVGDGLLLVVAKNDRKVRIATTKTLEGAVPDLAARQIIDTAITPRFRQGDFAGGLNAAADQLMARISGENLALPSPGPRPAQGAGGFKWPDLAMFLFIAVPVGAAFLTSVFGRKLGAFITGAGIGTLAWLLTASLVLAAVAAVLALLLALSGLGGMGRRGSLGGIAIGGGSWGGGGRSPGGGGFGSGGGGNFGGGGASGNW